MQQLKYSCRYFINGLAILLCLVFFIVPVHAASEIDDVVTIDRVELVTQQISLLKNRYEQSEKELAELQQQHDHDISQFTIEKINKNLLDKALLDISVAKSNLDSINIELTDSQQTLTWLEKNIQEIENQLNILGMFGLKVAPEEFATNHELRSDLHYQKKLFALEKNRIHYLETLQTIVSNILQLRKERYSRLNTLLKSRKMLYVKQQQVQDELAYQQQQNYWLKQLSSLYVRLGKLDPTKNHAAYAALEREIFCANENASLAYIQSLMARYKDQMQQMQLAIVRSNSISLLNEIRDQVQTLTKQTNRLETVLNSRMTLLERHITYLLQKKKNVDQKQDYIKKLKLLDLQYKSSAEGLEQLTKKLSAFRKTVEDALQTELSARQGFPTFGVKTLIDLGKEMLLVPALTFQVIKSLTTHLVKAFESLSVMGWVLFAFIECAFIFTCTFLRKSLVKWLARSLAWRDQLNPKWLSLEWLQRNFIDLAVIANVMSVLVFFDIPLQNFVFISYLSLVWLIFRGIMTIARLCLVETTHDTTGHDMTLYRRLKWVISIGAMITALTVFVHQLPLIYELKTLCNCLFLFLLMVVSFFLLRSWHVVPNLILSRMESQHPYLQKSIRLVGILIPILMLGNSVIGLLGFMNLIMTVSWYEGIFLLVLIGYLILRGLLSDAMEQVSRLMIQYVDNGWLWTEAFLKPIDNILRITLFLVAWAVLFLLYGWDKQSPIVERLMRLLHYKLMSVLNTTITPMSMIELVVVISIFYWTAKWTREFVYRLLLSRTNDMGVRNSIAILSQYSIIVVGIFICLNMLGIKLQALTVVASMFAFGIGLGLRDLANNFACGFLILLERPLRVGDIVNVSGIEGEVTHIGSRAVTVKTWDSMDLVVPNAEIFNKSFMNWTAKDNIVRSVVQIKISRYDNPHEVKLIIHHVLTNYKEILNVPPPEVLLKSMSDILMEFELRYFVNIRQVESRTRVISAVLMNIWDAFAAHGIKPPYPQHEVFLKGDMPLLGLPGRTTMQKVD